MNWEIVRETGLIGVGKKPAMELFMDGPYRSPFHAVQMLWRKCVEFEKNGTPYTRLRQNEDGVWQWMTGADRSYGHGLQNDVFIHIRQVA